MSADANNLCDRVELLARLRRRFGLRESDVSDDELLRVTEGTLGRAGIELNIAFEELVRAVAKEAKLEAALNLINSLFRGKGS